MHKTCGNCLEAAYFVCSRCNFEWYCSKKCQVEAFPHHRRECFSLPHLKIIGEEEMDKKSNHISESAEAINELPIQEIGNKNQEVDNYQEQVATQFDENSEEVREPKNEHKELVTPAFNQGVRTVAPNDYNYKKVPSIVSPPKSIDEKDKNLDNSHVNDNKIEKKFYSMDTMRRNQQMQLMNNDLRKKVKETRIFQDDLKFRPLKSGKNKVKLINGDYSTKIFFVMEASDLVDEYIRYIESNINDFVQSDKTTEYKPLKGEMILAKFEDIYYRAVVEDISDSVYSVFFVDYGNPSQVTEKDIKPFSAKLKNEIVLNTVLLQNLPQELNEKQEEYLLNEGGIDIDVIEESDNCYIANIMNI